MEQRKTYTMSEEDLKELLNACKPVVAMKIGDYVPSSPQQNANRAWERLGKKMGFDYKTVRPVAGSSDQKVFSAIPTKENPQ